MHAVAQFETGVCYGMLGNNLPPPSEVVALYKQNNIQSMRLFEPDPPTLEALQDSGIIVVLGVPNSDLQNLAASQANADTWVENNIKKYHDVLVRYIAVGNEVSPSNPDTARFAQYVLPAMNNLHNTIAKGELGIFVSTAIDHGSSWDLLSSREAGRLDPKLLPQIDLNYALFTSDGVVVPGGVKYQNLFYAILDAMYAALEKSGGSSVRIVVSETGWPSAGGDSTSVDNAKTYYTNLLKRVKDGTPKRPRRIIETYIFAMFDENQKTPEYEKHFGIFTPDKQSKYGLNFG
ncbi:hypothetical protein DH2020_007693 [Rehmannia glutinosa]|uniref:Glucan endo-1,3-beta-D-glucosidase n=1 Tax=Rehmannia glutinosa TaxID=99300 RepID=A0ABR0TZ86_REHGL